MNIGKLNKRIFFQRPIAEPDGYGGEKITYQDVCEVWAYIELLKDSERYIHSQLKSEATHRIVIRYTDEIDKTMRILYRGRVFEIESIIEDDFGLVLEVIQR